nr:MAG TPA: hypothetical protein [Caudoviricetes sp.]
MYLFLLEVSANRTIIMNYFLLEQHSLKVL